MSFKSDLMTRTALSARCSAHSNVLDTLTLQHYTYTFGTTGIDRTCALISKIDMFTKPINYNAGCTASKIATNGMNGKKLKRKHFIGFFFGVLESHL